VSGERAAGESEMWAESARWGEREMWAARAQRGSMRYGRR
jgi:hypothetical protein